MEVRCIDEYEQIIHESGATIRKHPNGISIEMFCLNREIPSHREFIRELCQHLIQYVEKGTLVVKGSIPQINISEVYPKEDWGVNPIIHEPKVNSAEFMQITQLTKDQLEKWRKAVAERVIKPVVDNMINDGVLPDVPYTVEYPPKPDG